MKTTENVFTVDAKNYSATAADIRKCLAAAEGK